MVGLGRPPDQGKFPPASRRRTIHQTQLVGLSYSTPWLATRKLRRAKPRAFCPSLPPKKRTIWFQRLAMSESVLVALHPGSSGSVRMIVLRVPTTSGSIPSAPYTASREGSARVVLRRCRVRPSALGEVVVARRHPP